jgi:hypothetical protein
MEYKSFLSFFVLIFAAIAGPARAQVFWSSYSPSGVTDDIWCVTCANGTFAAVTNQGNLLTSSNGTNWNSQAIDQGVWLVSIAYGNGNWVVVGDKGSILVSSDLKTWTHATSSATSNKLNGVLYNGSIWIAVGEAGTIVTSSDALNWTLKPAVPGVTGFLHGLALVTATGQPTSVYQGDTIVCGQSGVVLLLNPAGDPSGDALYLAGTAQDLEAAIVSPVTPGLAVEAGEGGTVVSDGHYASHSFGGGASPPQVASLSPAVILRGLTYGNGYYIAAGEQGAIFRSTDSVNWVQSYSGDSPSTLSTATLLSASYSAALQRFVVTGAGGTILVSNPPPTVFANVSTRGYVSSAQTFIGGFVIEGTAPRTVLIRADGPVLGTFNVAGPLADPVLTVFDNKGNVIATNTGWTTNSNPASVSAAAQEVGAFALPNPGKDSALLLTLPPGAYTAEVTSAGGNSGTALFEAYTN